MTLSVPQVKDIMEDIEADMAAVEMDDEEIETTTTEEDSAGTGVSMFYALKLGDGIFI